jgi:quinol monooxygenase YgiN
MSDGMKTHMNVADVEIAIVTMRFDAHDAATLHAVLSQYVVMARMVPGCRNIIQKWDDADVQRAHFDSPLMIEMAQSCSGLLSASPDIDLWDGVSAHDLN